jgi:hypothetical protein
VQQMPGRDAYLDGLLADATVAPQRRCDGATERCNTVSDWCGRDRQSLSLMKRPTASAARRGRLPSLDSPTGRSPRARPSRSSARSCDRLNAATSDAETAGSRGQICRSASVRNRPTACPCWSRSAVTAPSRVSQSRGDRPP